MRIRAVLSVLGLAGLFWGGQPGMAVRAASSDAVIEWGHPGFVTNDEVVNPDWPDYVITAFKVGGAWDTNIPAWRVEAGDTNEASLNIDLDRGGLSNSLILDLGFVDHGNSSLFLDLYDTNDAAIFTNVFTNIVSGSGVTTSRCYTVPLWCYSNAVGLRTERCAGLRSGAARFS